MLTQIFCKFSEKGLLVLRLTAAALWNGIPLKSFLWMFPKVYILYLQMASSFN